MKCSKDVTERYPTEPKVMETDPLTRMAEEKALERTKDRNSQEYVIALGEELRNVHLDGLLDSNGLPDKNKCGCNINRYGNDTS